MCAYVLCKSMQEARFIRDIFAQINCAMRSSCQVVIMQPIACLACLVGGICCKAFFKKYQVLNCMIVKQNMVTLSSGIQNYCLWHKTPKISSSLLTRLIFV